MTTRLWADVPEGRRRTEGGYSPSGCPYAVLTWDRSYYRQCAGAVPDGATMCASHDPERLQARGSVVDNLLRWRVRHARRGRDISDPLRWYRSLTDQEISEWRNVGQKTFDRAVEIRDTWTDEAVIAFFQFPKRRVKPQVDATVFWQQRHDVLSVMGG